MAELRAALQIVRSHDLLLQRMLAAAEQDVAAKAAAAAAAAVVPVGYSSGSGMPTVENETFEGVSVAAAPSTVVAAVSAGVDEELRSPSELQV